MSARQPRRPHRLASDTGDDDSEYRDALVKALGRQYEIRELLGAGGFGVVFLATERALDRPVAIKVLRRELSGSDAFLERFRREARTLAALRHPHILPLFAVGEVNDLLYMVTPYIAGFTLRGYLSHENVLGSTRAVGLLVEVARALEAAHALGIVHRDVKPENILLEGDRLSVVLMDFGIAKSISHSQLTAPDAVIGSLVYMSPEQASGGDVGPLSDLYSLGIVGYEMLTGHAPYAARTLYDLARLQVAGPEPLARLRPDVEPDVCSVIMKAMAIDPTERWRSVDECARALLRAAPRAVMLRWVH